MADSPYFQIDEKRLSEKLGTENVVFFDELPSTNSFVLENPQLFSIGQTSLVVAQAQTAGRGQGENVWESRRGNLAFSVVSILPLSPQDLLPHIAALPIAVGLQLRQTLVRALSVSTSQVLVKWPNDLICKQRKIAGILIETTPVSAGTMICIGIGLNVNSSWLSESVTEEVQRHFAPSSLAELFNCQLNLTELLVACFQELCPLVLTHHDGWKINREPTSFYGIGTSVRFESTAGNIPGYSTGSMKTVPSKSKPLVE
ncbi:MAG: biotin--[acetyl-CoA-carboxylase] ligase [Pirellulaceae bacterium]